MTGTRSFRSLFGPLALGLLACNGVITLPPDAQSEADGDGPGAAAPGSGGAAGSAGASAAGAGRASSENGGRASSENGGSSSSAGNGGAKNPDEPDPEPTCDAVGDPGPAPLRLLTRAQYLNTVRELLGDVAGLESALGPANDASEFGLRQGDIAQVDVENYQTAAAVIADEVTKDEDALSELVPCETGEPRTCARDFVSDFGARAYRAPLLDAADIERHLALYDQGAATSHARGIALVLSGILQAPRFLYRVEVGTSERLGTNAVKLSTYEVAARLAYALWDGPPDARLAELAASDALATSDGVAEQARRMLEDERGRPVVRRFLERFIHVNELDSLVKDEALYPEWSDRAFRGALREQASAFFDHVLGEQGGTLTSLFTSKTLFVNAPLANFYGVTGEAGLTRFERDDGTVSGLLTLPALLARLSKPAESSPIHRGKFVREALFCQGLPAPPALIPRPPEVEPNSSTRERLSQHQADPACSGCHVLIDPIGLGFEHYDGIGRYRTLDGGKPVDASGEITEVPDADGEFDGVGELAERLAESATVEECVARQWFRFMLERFEQDADRCSVERVLREFRAAEASLNVLPEAVVRTDAFLYRRPIEEVTP